MGPRPPSAASGRGGDTVRPSGSETERELTETRPGEPDTHFLKSGMGTYQVGQDTIEFGPGSVGPTRVSMAGKDYSWRNG